MPENVFIHPMALCESTNIGQDTRVWAFVHILPGASIGANCNICDHVFIENDVSVGDNVTIKCGVQLWDGTRLGHNVFVGPNATFTNDRFPRSKVYPEAFLQTVIEDGASIGANASILPGVRIGASAMIGAGAVVTRDVPAHAIVVGNPAVIVGYQESSTGRSAWGSQDPSSSLQPAIGARTRLETAGCWIERVPNFADMRGSLLALEQESGLPFSPRRVFMVYGVPNNRVRGEHAHHRCQQFLVAVAGSVSVVIDDGTVRQEVRLDDPSLGLYIAPLTWGTQYKFSSDCLLLVAASDPYDAQDYIRDYSEFRRLVSRDPVSG